MAVYKNKASQKVPVFAVDSAGAAKTGDAANISAQISLDGAATAATNDAAPIELDATDAPGVYLFDLTQAETNADLVVLAAKSSTSGVTLRPVIIYTEPEQRAADVTSISGDSTAADNLEAAADGTGYNLGGGSVVAASVSGSVASVTGNVGGNVTGSIGSLATQAKADVNAEADTALSDAGVTSTRMGYLTGSVALDSTVAKSATVALDATVAKASTALSNATWTDAKAGYLTGAVALDSTVAKDATVAKAATALSNATWTDTKAGYVDASVSSRSTLTAQQVWEYATRTVSSFGTLVADLTTSVWSAVARTITGGSLTTAPPTAGEIADAVWDEAMSGHLTAGTTGEALDGAGGSGTAPTVGEIADAVWDEATSGHSTAGSAGAAIIAAQSAGDPWSTALPGSYADGTAGQIVGESVPAIKAKTDNIGLGSITYQSSVDAAGSMRIYAGQDYDGSMAIIITRTSWAGPSLTGSTGKLLMQSYDNYQRVTREADLEFDAVISQNGDTVTATIELTDTESATIWPATGAEKPAYWYQVVATAGDVTVLVAEGKATSKKVMTEVAGA